MLVLITPSGRRYVHTSVYDKREHELSRWPQAKNYVHADSDIPVQFKLQIMISQTLRFSRLCSGVSEFAHRVAMCYVALVDKSRLDADQVQIQLLKALRKAMPRYRYTAGGLLDMVKSEFARCRCDDMLQ